MKYQKCLLYFGVSVIITILFYLLFTEQHLILHSIRIPVATLKSSKTNIYSISNPIGEIILKTDSKSLQPLFQSYPSAYYPHIPIHIYTQNLTSLKDSSKLILLGNGFFGEERWGLNTEGKSPLERSKNKSNIQNYPQSIFDF
jgi:hypothetical protein